MRVIFMGTPDFAIFPLERLILDGYQIVAVYTEPDKAAGRGRRLSFSPVKKLAIDHGLPLRQPASLKHPGEIEQLTGSGADVIVVAAFGKILPQQVLQLPPFGCINIHPSLLPRYRGPSPVAAAILAGDQTTGVTIILMESGVDSGPILAQQQAAISPEDTTGSLTARLAEIGAQLLVQTLPRWAKGEIKPQPQGTEGLSYTGLITKSDGEIDWVLAATAIWRRVRAFQPWPGCYTWWQGKMLKIVGAVPLSWESEHQPGRVMECPRPGMEATVGVVTGEGVLGLSRVQLEGGRILSAAEFIRGHRAFIGARLPDR